MIRVIELSCMLYAWHGRVFTVFLFESSCKSRRGEDLSRGRVCFFCLDLFLIVFFITP